MSHFQNRQRVICVGAVFQEASDIESRNCMTVCNWQKFIHKQMVKLENNASMFVGVVGPDHWVGQLCAVADYSELPVQPVEEFIEYLSACGGMRHVIRNRTNPPFKRVIQSLDVRNFQASFTEGF